MTAVRYRDVSFDIVDFHVVDLDDDLRFQSLTLRRPA